MTYTLADVAGLYRDYVGLFVGSGPTHYDYAKIIQHPGPVVGVNHATKVLPERDSIFAFSRHFNVVPCDGEQIVYCYSNELFKERFSHIKPKRSIVYNEYILPPKGTIDCLREHVRDGQIADFCDVDAMVKQNKLVGLYNSATFAIHFMAMLGCKEVWCVGAGPIDGEHKEGYDSRISTNPMEEQLRPSQVSTMVVEETFRAFGVAFKHIGCERN